MKRLFICLTALTMMFLCTACTGNTMAALYNNENKIAGDTDSYNLFEVQQTSRNRYFHAKVEKMEGIDTIWDYDASEDEELTMDCNLNVFRGKAKVILIHPDNSLETIIEMTENSEESGEIICPLSLMKGKNRLKIVAGEDTEFEIDIQIDKGTFDKIGF